MNEKEGLSYRRGLVEGASAVGLVVILYDQLVVDLTRAIASIESNKVEERSAQIKHALLVLGQLEGTLDFENGGQAAQQLKRFYTYLRGQVLEANFKADAEQLRTQVGIVLDVRRAWQELEGQSQHQEAAMPFPQVAATGEDREAFSCSV